MISRILTVLIISSWLIGCQPAMTSTTSANTPAAPALKTVARVERQDYNKATACLMSHNITVSTESTGPAKPGLLVDPKDFDEATKLLAADAMSKGYRLYEFHGPKP